MTEKEKAIEIIKNIIDYNGVEPWGRALRYAVKELEEKLTPDNNDYAKCPRCGSEGTFLYRTCGACDWNDYVE